MPDGFGPDPETGEFDRPFVDTLDQSLRDGVKDRANGPIDLSPGSPFGSLIDSVSDEFASAWESEEAVYYAAYAESAHDIQLDRIFALGLVGRLERRGATGEVVFRTGDTAAGEAIDIPTGTRVGTKAIPEEDTPQIPFVVTEDAVLAAGDTETDPVAIRGAEPTELRGVAIGEQWLGAETNVAAGTITELIDPIGGIPSSGGVTNPFPTGEPGTRADGTAVNFRRGRDRERDYQYRQRWQSQLAQNATATLPALKANMYALDGGGLVTGVRVAENVHWEARDGLPPKSIHLTVDMPHSQDNIDAAAQAITDTRSGGIQTVGVETGTATLPGGRAKDQSLDLTESVEIFVNVDLEVYRDAFPTNGAELVERNVLAYIGGDYRGIRLAGQVDVGEPVVYDKVESAVTTGLFSAIQRRDVTIGRSAPPESYADIDLGTNESAYTSPAAISVSVNEVER